MKMKLELDAVKNLNYHHWLVLVEVKNTTTIFGFQVPVLTSQTKDLVLVIHMPHAGNSH